MRHIYYILQTLLRSRSGMVVKLLSLTLGLLVGVLLFSQIVYELNYDTGYKDHERLGLFGIRMVSDEGVIRDWEYDTFRPAAAALMDDLPDLVECATPVFAWYIPKLYLNNRQLTDIQVIFADTLYFKTMGIEVLKGDPRQLANIGSTFLSESKARQLFGSEDAIGKTINMDKMFDLTVRGIYKDVPGNVSFPHNLLISLPTVEDGTGYGQGTWTNNDVYMVHARLRSDADVDEVNSRVTQLLAKYMPAPRPGRRLEGRILPVSDCHLSDRNNVQRLVLLGVLGFAIFFVAGMNYVLAAVATIGRRAKMVGVHKCSGADSRHILALFLWETGLMLVAAIACAGLLMLLLKDPIEDMLGISRIDQLFTLQTLWAPLLTVLLLFLVAGVLPGRMFPAFPLRRCSAAIPTISAPGSEACCLCSFWAWRPSPACC